jgi:hypothetical protein
MTNRIDEFAAVLDDTLVLLNLSNHKSRDIL